MRPRAAVASAVPSGDRLLTVFDVAAFLQLRPATVRRMAALGQLGYHRLNSKELRFAKSDVDALLARTRMEVRR